MQQAEARNGRLSQIPLEEILRIVARRLQSESWDQELWGHRPGLLAYGAENTVFWSRVVGRQLVLVSDHFIVFR